MNLLGAFTSGIFAALAVTTAQAGQLAPEQDALSRNCNAISIDQCYRDGLIRLINGQFSPQISSVLTDDQRNIFRTVRFSVVEDPNALGASSIDANGALVTTITSSVGYHLALFGNAAAVNVLSGKDLTSYSNYQEKVVQTLLENTQRARLGQALLPTPSFSDAGGLDGQTVSELMNNDTALGMSAYFTFINTFWVLAHETGHQLLGQTKLIADQPATPRKHLEMAADEFASRSLVKMGYSVYPAIFLMGYFAAIEQAGAGSSDYPSAVCRLAYVFKSAWSERANGAPPGDAVNQQWNQIMDQPALRNTIDDLLSGSQCQD
jgi:hypothetical protein